jgi:deazaflavin-dependent oxidoreductase (nitroreductase family)
MCCSDLSWAALREFRRSFLRQFANVLIKPLARLGLGGKRLHVLTHVGRKTGRRYSTPVSLVFMGGERWLVAPYGVRQWVRNARAAGGVELTRARRTERFRVEEVDPQTAAPILREYLRSTPIVKDFFDADRDASLAEFAAEAARHPVFRLVRSNA